MGIINLLSFNSGPESRKLVMIVTAESYPDTSNKF